MENEITYLRIFKDKNGEIDFGVSSIEGWDYEKQREVMSTILTAIYILEDAWRSEREKNPENQAKYNLEALIKE